MASDLHGDRLCDDMVTEILLRLPPADAVRSRAVCRAWRRIAASPAFVAAHARRQPLEIILTCGGWLHTAPVSALGETRRLHLRGGSLVGACGALLLLETNPGRDHVVGNPTTRQWASLPDTPSFCVRLCGLYIHGPSGEHRLLYLHNDRRSELMKRTASHRVLTLGAAEEARRIGPPFAAIEPYSQMPEAYLQHRGKLHWLRHPEVHETDAILAFDTVSETFRRISRPPLVRSQNDWAPPRFLVEAHGNLAVAAVLDDGSMDLWVMEDYDSDSSWRRRLRITLPPPLRSASWAVNASDLGQDVILLEDVSVQVVVLYDLAAKKVVKQVELQGCNTRLHHFVFRDSLERHAFLPSTTPSS